MPRQPHRPRPLQWQVFRGTETVHRGLLTAHQLRSEAWLRVHHDIYADARLDRDHRLVCQAVGLWLPPYAAIAGPSAAFLHGVEHAAGFTDAVHVITPPTHRRSPRQGVRIHHTSVEASEFTVRDGVRCTTPTRTAWDVAVWLHTLPAVTVIDGLLRLGLVDREGLRVLAASQTGRRGASRAARAFDLADGRAESPPESQLRVRLVSAGLPRPVPQYEILLPNGRTYRVDLAWPECRIAIEYDGQWHGSPDQFHADRRRLNQLAAAGWIVLHVTSQRLYRDFAGVLREIRAALRTRTRG